MTARPGAQWSDRAAGPVPTVPGWDAAHDDRLYYACGGCGAHAGLPCEPGCISFPGSRGKHSPVPPGPDGCGYLHSAFGPGCPYCTAGGGGTTAQALVVEAQLIAAGFTKAERAAFLAAWDKLPADWTDAEAALIAKYDSRRAVA